VLRGIPKDHLKAIVADTPLINKQAIAFYQKMGFVKALGLSGEFSKTWNRMSKPE
jgi:ribosomal protein S18 acetylase RimI-like enzyme